MTIMSEFPSRFRIPRDSRIPYKLPEDMTYDKENLKLFNKFV